MVRTCTCPLRPGTEEEGGAMKTLRVHTPDGADGWAIRTLTIRHDGTSWYRIENGWGEEPFSTLSATETNKILSQYSRFGWERADA